MITKEEWLELVAELAEILRQLNTGEIATPDQYRGDANSRLTIKPHASTNHP